MRIPRSLIALCGTLAALAACVPPARAGTYDILACDAYPNHSFNAWQREAPTLNGTMMVYASYCDGDPGKVNDIDSNGLISRSSYDWSWTLWDDGRGWRMNVPSGNSILGITWAGTLRRPSSAAGAEGWYARIADTGGPDYLACPPNTGPCTYNQTSPAWIPVPANGGRRGVEAGSYCMSVTRTPCWNAWSVPFLNTAAASMARLRYIDVRVEDATPPAIATTGPGAGYVTGIQTVRFSASDDSGIRLTRLFVDGVQQGSDTSRACDFSNSPPCGPVDSSYDIDTTKLGAGSHTYRVEAVDAGANARSASGTFSVGEDKPAAPELARPPAGWISAPSYTELVGYPAAAATPASGVAGYSVTTNGSTPGASVNASGRDASYSFAPVEGITTLRARTVSGAGTLSDTSEVTLRVDRTPPVTSVLGAGVPGRPSSGPVDLTLLGTDQPGLSGMGAGDRDEPVASGGHLDYRVDGGGLVQVRGDEADLHLAQPGTHTIEFRAYDVAQNASPPRSLEVTVGSPPAPVQHDREGFWDDSASTATFTAAPSFAASCPPDGALAAGAYAYVDEAEPDAAHGSPSQLLVRSEPGQRSRAMLGFDLPAIGDCYVRSAELRLRQAGGAAGRTLSAYRLGSAWSASSVTWSTRPGAAGAPAAATSPGSGWVSFDVTAQVRGMYRSGNSGLVVQDDGDGAATETFGTSPPAQLLLDLG